MTQKLHDDIFSQLPEDFIRRMWNWARWRSGGSVTISSGLWDRVGDTGLYEAKVPLLMGEGADTNKAVYALPQRYQEVITIFWMHNSHTLSWMAACTPRTRLWKLGQESFRQWLDIGHERLRSELARQGREAACRRADSEQSQQKAQI